ncbi:elongation factor P [Kiritimatiellaeota bacterium B1221]|nr:elongation factor P [Kiritimatiellaeota bacterium B1221]
MSIKVRDLSKNHIINLNNAPHKLESLHVQNPSARGGSSLYKMRFRNLVTQNKTDVVMKGEDPLEEVEVDTIDVQFAYQSGNEYTFMDNETYEQYDLPKNEVEHILPYLVEDMEGVRALIQEGRVLTLLMPDVVELEITECDPSIKGASATARTKPATLSTGLIVQVPEYMAAGEIVRVDTRTDACLGRV